MKKQQKPHLSNNILCNLSAGARSSSIIRFYCDPRTKSDSNTQPVKKQQITEQPNDRTPRNDGSSLATHRIERRISSGTQGLICTNYCHHVDTGWIFLTFFFWCSLAGFKIETSNVHYPGGRTFCRGGSTKIFPEARWGCPSVTRYPPKVWRNILLIGLFIKMYQSNTESLDSVRAFVRACVRMCVIYPSQTPAPHHPDSCQ